MAKKKTRRKRDEWIELKNTTWRQFEDHGFAQPGTQVKVQLGRKIRSFWIGDINKLGGVCDDCMDFDYEDQVVAYRKIKLPEND